jgi:hypothetical protein
LRQGHGAEFDQKTPILGPSAEQARRSVAV